MMKSAGDGKMEVQRAKTALQFKRNGSLARACDLIKKDPRAKDKSVEIIWKKDGIKDRFVEMDNIPIFQQTSADLIGSFFSPFQDLVL